MPMCGVTEQQHQQQQQQQQQSLYWAAGRFGPAGGHTAERAPSPTSWGEAGLASSPCMGLPKPSFPALYRQDTSLPWRPGDGGYHKDLSRCRSGSYTEGCFFPTRPRGSPRAAQRAPDESRPSRRTFEELLKTCRQETLQAHFGCPGHRAVRSRSCSKPCLDTTFQEMLGNPPKQLLRIESRRKGAHQAARATPRGPATTIFLE